MVILHADNKVMRLPAILPDALIWKAGEIWSSNWKLAVDAGGCSVKTIQREIEWFRLRGLLSVDYGWKRNQSGQLCKTRLIRLGIPADYQGPIPELEDHDQADTRGPDGEGHQADTSGPDGVDTHGPIYVEYTEGEVEANDAV